VRGLRFACHNNCPRCPIIGAEDIPEVDSSSSASALQPAGRAETGGSPRCCAASILRGSSLGSITGIEFLVYLLPNAETLTLLRSSMGKSVLDHF
jgi:hypothetical protein